MSENTISSAVPWMVALVAKSEGIDPSLVLRTAELTLDAPPVPDEHVELARYLEVWRRAMALVRDPAFPLRAAKAFQLEDHEVFGFLAMSCETLGQAYERTALFRGLYCVGARWELEADKESTRLIWYPWPGDLADPGYKAAQDYAVADMEKAIRRLGVMSPRPEAVRLAHAAPENVTPFTEYYGVAPTFGSKLYELIYPPNLRDQKVASFNSKLRDYFEQECRRVISKHSSSATTLTEQVRKQLVRAMDGGDVSIEAVAKKLGMSTRSVQRRLLDEDKRFNDILSEVRTEFAKRYLARKTISASEVAYLLGFTEPPAFFKAFKRWTGMTPREYQQSA